MNTINLKNLLLVVLGLALSITGIANAYQQAGQQLSAKQLIGQWQEVDGPETINFTKDHGITITFDQKDCFSLSGKYAILNGQEISVELEGAISAFIKRLILNVTIDGGFLYLTDIDAENTDKDIETKIRRKKPFTKYEKVTAKP